MNAKVVIVATGILVSAVAAIASILFERRRYLTNNPNATGEDFRVHADPICPICQDSMDVSRPNVTLLPCGHYLHDDCLRSMNENRDVLQTNRCPICRTPFRF